MKLYMQILCKFYFYHDLISKVIYFMSKILIAFAEPSSHEGHDLAALYFFLVAKTAEKNCNPCIDHYGTDSILTRFTELSPEGSDKHFRRIYGRIFYFDQPEK